MVLYFSGTGNSRFVAKKIAGCPAEAIEYGKKTQGFLRHYLSEK